MTDFGGAIKQSQDYNIAIIGIPFDEKSCYLREASKGPQAIRAASTGKAINAWTELGRNLEVDGVLVDLGDVDATGNFEQVFSRIERSILESMITFLLSFPTPSTSPLTWIRLTLPLLLESPTTSQGAFPSVRHWASFRHSKPESLAWMWSSSTQRGMSQE